MNDFLKVFLLVLLSLAIVHFFPVLIAPFLFLGGLLLAVLALAGVVALALSPLWVPLLLVFGVIALFRRGGRGATAAPVA